MLNIDVCKLCKRMVSSKYQFHVFTTIWWHSRDARFCWWKSHYLYQRESVNMRIRIIFNSWKGHLVLDSESIFPLTQIFFLQNKEPVCVHIILFALLLCNSTFCYSCTGYKNACIPVKSKQLVIAALLHRLSAYICTFDFFFDSLSNKRLLISSIKQVMPLWVAAQWRDHHVASHKLVSSW